MMQKAKMAIAHYELAQQIEKEFAAEQDIKGARGRLFKL